MIALYLVLAFFVGYLFGNISFSRIFARIFWKEDITKEGSGNPGTINVLRTKGFGEAILTLVFDAIKAGGPALGGYFLFEHFFEGYGNLAYFLIAFGAILGHCFPVFLKFKGGKGVACTFGMFLFHPVFWWGALIVFACGFVVFLFVRYAFVVTVSAMLALTIYATVYFSLNVSTTMLIPLLVILWVNMALLVFMHRGNIKRLREGTENKVNLLEKLKSKKKPKLEMSVETSKEEVKKNEETNSAEEENEKDEN